MQWEELPPAVRFALELRLGARVVSATTQRGGFSPGLAARLMLSDRRRVFMKAVSEDANPDTPRMHRREAGVVAALPASAPVPRLLWTYDSDGWVALCFEDVEGRQPSLPWRLDELRLVVGALEGMSRALEPWVAQHLERLAVLEARAPAAAAGDTLLHFDERADNLLIAGERVYVVDWPSACIGAPWVDWVAMAPSVAMQGGPGPEEFLRMFDVGEVSRDAIDAVVCSLAGYFVVRALDPPPPGLPTVRAFQAAQGVVGVRWLRERVGW